MYNRGVFAACKYLQSFFRGCASIFYDLILLPKSSFKNIFRKMSAFVKFFPNLVNPSEEICC